MTAVVEFPRGVRRLACCIAVAVLGTTVVGSTDHPRGVPASEGIPNFGRVTDSLFRGAQPDENGLASLKRLGVGTVINLRMSDDVWPAEQATVLRLGMIYVNVPLHGLSAPTDADVARVLALIASSPGPVFIHCQHGADRTGTMVACYRMRHDGWTVGRAMEEAKHYGLSDWQQAMIHYLRNYPKNSPGSPSPAGTGH